MKRVLFIFYEVGIIIFSLNLCVCLSPFYVAVKNSRDWMLCKEEVYLAYNYGD